MSAERADAVVVGGGITGLVAARELVLAGASVTLLEPERVGGKVARTAFDGELLDEAADAFLARVPEGVELCRALGIDGTLVSPAQRRAFVWSHGALRPLPEAHVLGVPTDLDELAATGLVSPDGLAAARADLERPLEAPTADVAIGPFLRARFGHEVVDRLIDPLVGGINAGAVDQLSLAAVVPQLDAAARSGAPSLIAACAAQRAANPDPAAPVFFAPAAGMGALVEALQADLLARGVRIRPVAALGLAPAGPRWQVRTDHDTDLTADVVVLAAPAPQAAALLDGVPGTEGAAAHLAAVDHASVALVALAVAPDAVGRDLDGSGYLIPRVEGRTVTACSWTSSKWPHQHGDGTVWLRASVGRHGDDRAVHLDDTALLAAVTADLADTMQLHGPIRAHRVTRWWRSFPQYAPGHLDRVAAVEAELATAAPGLALAGAWGRGLGVPACIRQGAAAADRALTAMGAPR